MLLKCCRDCVGCRRPPVCLCVSHIEVLKSINPQTSSTSALVNQTCRLLTQWSDKERNNIFHFLWASDQNACGPRAIACPPPGPAYLPVCLSVCLSVWLAGWLAVWLSVFVAVWLAGGLSVCLYYVFIFIIVLLCTSALCFLHPVGPLPFQHALGSHAVRVFWFFFCIFRFLLLNK